MTRELRAGAALALAGALTLGCAGHRVVACNAMLARPSVLVDVTAFAAAHPGVKIDLCPRSSTATVSPAERCTSVGITVDGRLATPTPAYDDPAGTVRVYLTPGDDRLIVKVPGDRSAGGTVVLTGHRSHNPCGGFVYDTLRLTTTGQPVVVRR